MFADACNVDDAHEVSIDEMLSDRLAILRRPKLLIEPSTYIRVSRGEKLLVKCSDPYEAYRTKIHWFRFVV